MIPLSSHGVHPGSYSKDAESWIVFLLLFQIRDLVLQAFDVFLKVRSLVSISIDMPTVLLCGFKEGGSGDRSTLAPSAEVPALQGDHTPTQQNYDSEWLILLACSGLARSSTW